MSLSGKTVVVTGAGGFIGSHLVEALIAEGAKVRALVRYNGRDDHGMLDELEPAKRDAIEVVLGDVRDPFGMEKLIDGAEVVFHLAALIGIPYSYRAPADYVATNVVGTLNVLEACRKHGVSRLLNTSTSEVYGSALYVPIDEKHPLQGQSPYSASKIGADAMAESYHRSFEQPVVTVRPFNTYGPRQSARAVIPTILSQLLGGDRLRLGSVDPIRDLNYVGDTVAGFLALADCDRAIGRTVNLGSGSGVSIGDVAKQCMTIAGVVREIETETARVRPEASEVSRLIAEASLAQELAGWKSRVSLESGLTRTCDYIRDHLGRYRSERYTV